jgi:hypothetical protein
MFDQTSFNDLNNWLQLKSESSIDPEIMVKIRFQIVDAILNKNYKKLSEIYEILVPMSNKAINKLEKAKIKKVENWIMDLAELPVLVTMIRGAMFNIRHIDPEAGLDLIEYGRQVVHILQELFGMFEKKVFDPEIELKVTPEDVLKYWKIGIYGEIDEDTVSCILSALEQARFVHRLGAIEERRYRLLEKARNITDF